MDTLTTREMEVFRLITRGLSNAEIGHELFISDTTVKTHVTRLLQKLDLRDRAQAIVLAYQTGPASTRPSAYRILPEEDLLRRCRTSETSRRRARATAFLALRHPSTPRSVAMITIESLTKKYGATTAVDDISFIAARGPRDRLPRSRTAPASPPRCG